MKKIRRGQDFVLLPNGKIRLTKIWNIEGFVPFSNKQGYVHFYDLDGDRRNIDVVSTEFLMRRTE